MSVYTDLSRPDIVTILADYDLGTYRQHEGIAAGIENSNFFVDTADGRYVLTVFERMQPEELPYFMDLMRHLASRGLACPDVMVRRDGSLLFEVHGKQGCIISRLAGHTLERLNDAQLYAAGRTLAAMHLAGSDFSRQRRNPTGTAWLKARIEAMADDVAVREGVEAAGLLADELDWQWARRERELPGGVVHADYFCDNLLFEGDEVAGVIDFYYACDDAYAMDVAIAMNALAVSASPAGPDRQRMLMFLQGYESVRAMNAAEHDAMPVLLRLAALRFWVSRLYDALYPRAGAMTQVKDPAEYQAKLQFHRA